MRFTITTSLAVCAAVAAASQVEGSGLRSTTGRNVNRRAIIPQECSYTGCNGFGETFPSKPIGGVWMPPSKTRGSPPKPRKLRNKPKKPVKISKRGRGSLRSPPIFCAGTGCGQYYDHLKPSYSFIPESPKRTSGDKTKKMKKPVKMSKRSRVSPDPICNGAGCGRYYEHLMPSRLLFPESPKRTNGGKKKSKPVKSKRALIKPDILPQACPYTGCDGYERSPSIWEAINAPERRRKNPGEKNPGKKSGKKNTNQRGGEIDYDDVDSSYNQRAMYEDYDEYNQRIGRTLEMIF
ncbi:hypothetical protein FBU59_002319 [Linderina macrospora]|uniref:Uncharacterized protein n=1 Tax=Linderina macrospora TaxID=4868 RepID=A0ACC1JBG4_9FUNG|nr:hypothetical protein FBU59_002319 [Linderina macrospora]